MASASSQRYQSRLFNFVHKQSRHWSEGIGRTFRHLQIAAIWSLEALIYPVFLLIQKAVESANKQLHPGQQPQKLQLEAQANDTDFQPETLPVADFPIQQVLQAVESLQLQSRLTPPFVHIRGIASNLSNRQLLLVSSNNEILDIFTPQQQQQLQDRIIAEVANYWRCWRLSQVTAKTNLFGEINNRLTKLTSSSMPALSPGIGYSYLLNTERSLTLLDATVAKLETNTLEPVSRASWQLIQFLQTRFQIFIYKEEVATHHLKNQTSNIQNLIWAAINFFFGEHPAKKLEQTTPSQSKKFLQRSTLQTFLKKPELQSEGVDLWLSESDLFGDFHAVSESTHNQVSNQQLVADYSTPNFAVCTTHCKSSAGLVQRQKQSAKFTTGTHTASTISQLEKHGDRTKISQQQSHQATGVEAKPDWIETKAKIVGYEKHPLERILELLDRSMLWLEELFASIFQMLQKLWRGK
ncbi:MAG: hypothetical protein N2235_00915 [Fischerella sp.]|nr:hypothetical protein [Fischerella sp.]